MRGPPPTGASCCQRSHQALILLPVDQGAAFVVLSAAPWQVRSGKQLRFTAAL